jgi:hypothetical protein
LLNEIGEACSVSTTRDAKYVESRLEAEGDKFLTVALPAFEKDLTRSLALGRIPSDAFVGYARREVRASLFSRCRGVPEFLGGFLDLLFKSEQGDLEGLGVEKEVFPEPVLRPVDPEDMDPRTVMAVKGIRQLCLIFSKEKALCDQSQIDRAISSYLEIDGEVMRPLWMSEETYFSKVVFSTLSEGLSVRFSGRHYPKWIKRSTRVGLFLITVLEQRPISVVVILSGLYLTGMIDLITYSLTGNMLYLACVSRARTRESLTLRPRTSSR